MGMFDNTATATSPDENATETVEIDLNAEVVAENPEADFNERKAPPTGNLVYPVQWSLDEKGVVPAMTKNGVPFVHVYLKGKLLVQGNYAGFPINDYINSVVFSGGTSEVHHFAFALGESIAQRIVLGLLKEKIEEILANEPAGLALLDWKASIQDGINPKTGKAKYKDLRVGMANFPKQKNPETGEMEYKFLLESPVDGSPVPARIEVVKHVSAAEVQKEKLQMAS